MHLPVRFYQEDVRNIFLKYLKNLKNIFIACCWDLPNPCHHPLKPHQALCMKQEQQFQAVLQVQAEDQQICKMTLKCLWCSSSLPQKFVHGHLVVSGQPTASPIGRCPAQCPTATHCQHAGLHRPPRNNTFSGFAYWHCMNVATHLPSCISSRKPAGQAVWCWGHYQHSGTGTNHSQGTGGNHSTTVCLYCMRQSSRLRTICQCFLKQAGTPLSFSLSLLHSFSLLLSSFPCFTLLSPCPCTMNGGQFPWNQISKHSFLHSLLHSLLLLLWFLSQHRWAKPRQVGKCGRKAFTISIRLLKDEFQIPVVHPASPSRPGQWIYKGVNNR